MPQILSCFQFIDPKFSSTKCSCSRDVISHRSVKSAIQLSMQPVFFRPHSCLVFFLSLFFLFFFLKGHFLYFSLCPLPLVLSLVTTEKSLSQSASLHPTSYLCTLIRSPLSLFFSRLNNSSASFCFSSHSFLHVSHSLGSGHAFVCLHGELCQGSDLGWK